MSLGLRESNAYPSDVPEAEATQVGSKPGRCVHHPGVARAAVCDVCGASLCMGCAVPVRGVAVGPECLATVLNDAEPATLIPAATVNRADAVAAFAFGLVVALSILPWSRFGAASGPFLAWTPHWSLFAVGSAVVGLLVAVAPVRRRWNPVVEVALLIALAVAVATGAFLHYDRPPPLSSPTIVPFIAGLAGVVVVAEGLARAIELVRMRRPSTGSMG
jgi:hypothetical protein